MKTCIIEGCEGESKKRGWCLFHYDRWRLKGDPLAGGPRRLPPNSLGKCFVDGCENDAVSKNLCSKHYAKLAKFGDPQGGYVQDGRSKEWRKNKDGYVYKFDPLSQHSGGNKLVYQHRLIIGEKIGRPLKSSESVHHVNGDRSDNRIENLELWAKGQPAGQRVQDQVIWARKVLSEYGNLVDKCF